MGAWIAQVNALGVLVVGMALGLEMRGKSLTPCPGCGAESRGDHRGPIGTGDGKGWRCFRCDRAGGPIDLVSLQVFGEVLHAGDERWGSLRERCTERGLLGGKPLNFKAPSTIVRTTPPPWEVDLVWHACRSASQDAPVRRWLLSRKLPPERLAELDLVRALAPDARYFHAPDWLHYGRKPEPLGIPWYARREQFRAIVALWNPRGELTSLHGRAVASKLGDDALKSISPREHSTFGLVMANTIARELLAGVSSYEADHAKVVIAEGVPDFLTLGSSYPTTAVFGVISGSWTEAVAERIPDGRRVVIATDQDDDGEKYSREISRTLAGRCSVARWRAKGDVNEVGFKAGTVEEVR